MEHTRRLRYYCVLDQPFPEFETLRARQLRYRQLKFICGPNPKLSSQEANLPQIQCMLL